MGQEYGNETHLPHNINTAKSAQLTQATDFGWKWWNVLKSFVSTYVYESGSRKDVLGKLLHFEKPAVHMIPASTAFLFQVIGSREQSFKVNDDDDLDKLSSVDAASGFS